MRRMRYILAAIFVVSFSVALVFAQTAGDYRSKQTGNWSSASTWQRYSGSAWANALIPPDSTVGGGILILDGHTVTVDVDEVLKADSVNVQQGATLIINSGVRVELRDSSLNHHLCLLKIDTLSTVTVNGTLVDKGRTTSYAGTTTFGSGSTYELAHAASSGRGIPTATWDNGSTCLITGITNSTTGINANQSFYNVIVDCPNWSGNNNFGWGGTSTPSPTTINGDVTVRNTGVGRWQLCPPTAGTAGARNAVTVTIKGNLIVDGSTSNSTNLVTVTSNGTSNAYTDVTINVQGNIVVTGNPADVSTTNFSASRGSQGGLGTAIWNLYGDFSMSDATTQNSNSEGAKFVFAKSGTQTLTLTNVSYGSGTGAAFNVDVDSGSTLNLGTSTLGSGPNSSTGSFRVLPGATIATGNPGGLDSSITSSGAHGGGNSFSTSGNYTFNGTTPQVTGFLMPDTLNALTIDNPTSVKLTKNTTVNDTLHLKAGVFDIQGVTLSYGPHGVRSDEGGTITAVKSTDLETIPHSFSLRQNYPNPFNPTTTITYDVPKASEVTIAVYDVLGRKVATLVNETKSAGEYTISFDGSKLASGVYFYRMAARQSVVAGQAESYSSIRKLVLMK
jgi:hypothetical protein